jgi:hypothetical protein
MREARASGANTGHGPGVLCAVGHAGVSCPRVGTHDSFVEAPPMGLAYLRRSGRGLMHVAGALSGTTEAGPVKRWIYGLGGAGLLMAYGLWLLLSNWPPVVVIARGGRVTGLAAVALSVAPMAFGLFLHFHFLWTPHERLWRVAGWGKTACAAILVLCLGYFAVWGIVMPFA